MRVSGVVLNSLCAQLCFQCLVFAAIGGKQCGRGDGGICICLRAADRRPIRTRSTLTAILHPDCSGVCLGVSSRAANIAIGVMLRCRCVSDLHQHLYRLLPGAAARGGVGRIDHSIWLSTALACVVPAWKACLVCTWCRACTRG